MAHYLIGDVHGCRIELETLLSRIGPTQQDHLWFAGDLVNRGPDSLGVLRVLHALAGANSVLGNHDLHWLHDYYLGQATHRSDLSKAIRQASDAEALMHWLRHRPFLLLDAEEAWCLVHAGLWPSWSLREAKQYAESLSLALQGEDYRAVLANMYGNQPDRWCDSLQGYQRLRVLMSIFTRMRYLKDDGAMDFEQVGPPGEVKPGLMPWYDWPRELQARIFFGHWASLKGKVMSKRHCGIDGACVWGGDLLAFDVSRQQLIRVKRQTV